MRRRLTRVELVTGVRRCGLQIYVWCSGFGVPWLVLGGWWLVVAAWCLVLGAWCLVFGGWCLVLCRVPVSGMGQARSARRLGNGTDCGPARRTLPTRRRNARKWKTGRDISHREAGTSAIGGGKKPPT